MATKDFRASQVETSKIIASGSIAGSTVGIAIYSGSVASNREGGTTDSKMLENVGPDVFLFVSGTISNDNNNRTDATLFGGDVVVSGTLYAERQVIEVDSVADGDFFVTGSMFVEPDVNSTKSVAFRKSDGTDIFVVDSTNSRVGINDNSPDAILDVVGGSSSGAPTLIVEHGEDIFDGVDIIGDSVTTAKVVDISADGLTTGNALFVQDNSSSPSTRSTVEIQQAAGGGRNAKALKVTSAGGKTGISLDKDYVYNSGTTVTGIDIDLDKSSATTSDNNIIGVNVDTSNTTPTNGTNKMRGIEVRATLQHAADAGTPHVTAVDATAVGSSNGASVAIAFSGSAAGADTTIGLQLDVESSGKGIKLLDTTDSSNFSTFHTAQNGETTIETVDDGGSAANLNLNIDGHVKIQPATAMSVTINDGGLTSDFRVEAADKPGAILVDGGTKQVAILSDGDSATTSYKDTTSAVPRELPDDIGFYVSGSIGGMGTLTGDASKGTAVFAGDLVVSGASLLKGDVTVDDGASLIVPVAIKHKNDINTNITFNNDRIRFITNNATNVDITTNQVIVVPGVGAAPTESEGVDINFYTSGAIGSRGTTTRGTSVFGGDLVVSGNVTALGTTTGFASPLTVREADGNPNVNNVTTINVSNGTLTDDGGGTVTLTNIGNTLDQAYDQGGAGAGAVITVSGQPVQLVRGTPGDIALAITGSSIFGETSAEFANNLPPLPGDDVTFFVSGSTKSLGSNTGGVASFGGDVVVSGTLVMHERFDLLFGHHMTKNSITGDGPFLLINAGDTVMIGSGSGPSAAGSPDEANYTDINFFVSGAMGSRGSVSKGTSLFGGDVFVSGALGINTVTITTDGKVGIGTDQPSTKLEVGGNATFGEKLLHRNDTDTFIMFDTDEISFTAGNELLLTLKEAGQDIVTVGDGGDVDFRVQTAGDTNTIFAQGNTGRVGMGTNSPASILHLKESAPTLSIQRESNGNSSTVAFLGSAGHTGAIMHMSASNDLVFKTFDGVQPQEIMRLGGHYSTDIRQVVLLSGSDMHTTAMHPQKQSDINFFVSGAIDSKGSTTRGTSVFGGDVVVSGSIYGKRLQTYHFVDRNSASGTEFFFGTSTMGGTTTFDQAKHQSLTPYPGSLKKILVRSTAGDNSNPLVIKFYTNNGVSAQAGTPKTINVPINASSPAQNNVTQEVHVENATFGSGNPFAFSMERASTAPGDVHLTAVFEYDVFDK